MGLRILMLKGKKLANKSVKNKKNKKQLPFQVLVLQKWQ